MIFGSQAFNYFGPATLDQGAVVGGGRVPRMYSFGPSSAALPVPCVIAVTDNLVNLRTMLIQAAWIAEVGNADFLLVATGNVGGAAAILHAANASGLVLADVHGVTQATLASLSDEMRSRFRGVVHTTATSANIRRLSRQRRATHVLVPAKYRRRSRKIRIPGVSVLIVPTDLKWGWFGSWSWINARF